MANRKGTKRALLSSCMAMVLCLAMLVGTTFAWFTDSASSSNNRIQAGTLEIDLLMDKAGNDSYESIADKTGDIFSETTGNGIRWEPGKTEIVYLAVRNMGSLALKYNIVLDIIDGGLVGSLEYAVLPGVKAADLAEVKSWTELSAIPGAQIGDVTAGRLLVAENGCLDEIVNGVQKETDYFALAVHMKEDAGNEYQGDGIKVDVTVIAAQAMAETDSFGADYDEAAEWPATNVIVTKDNVDVVNFSGANTIFEFQGSFDKDIEIPELGKGSEIIFNNVTVAGGVKVPDGTVVTGDSSLTANSESAAITGSGDLSFVDGSLNIKNDGSGNAVKLDATDAKLTFENMSVVSDDAFSVDNTDETSAEMIVKNSTLNMPHKSINVSSPDGSSTLTVEDSWIDCGTVFVGAHVMNEPKSIATFNVKDSYVYARQTTLGAAIAVWGRAGVTSDIQDSEIYVYNQGWHQSEDANGFSLFFEGGGTIDVNIERTNMHLYGARALLRVRRYYSPDATINFAAKDSLIWTISKDDSSGLSIDGTTADSGLTTQTIENVALIRTRNAYSSTATTTDSEVIGSPTIYGNFNVINQSGWEHTVKLEDGQTLTIAEDAKITRYDGAAAVDFELSGTAKLIVKTGAEFKNFGVKAADGYTLVTETSDGTTTYSVK